MLFNEAQLVVIEDEGRPDLDPGDVLLRDDVQVALEDRHGHGLVGPHLLDLLEHIRSDLGSRLCSSLTNRLSRPCWRSRSPRRRSIGLREGSCVVVRVDVVGVPAEEVGGHLLVVELLLVGGPLGALHSHLEEGRLFQLRLEDVAEVDFGVAVVARRIPKVESERLVLAVAGAREQLLGQLDVAVAESRLEIVAVVDHADGDHRVQGEVLAEENLLDDLGPVDEGGDGLPQGLVLEHALASLEVKVADEGPGQLIRVELRVLAGP